MVETIDGGGRVDQRRPRARAGAGAEELPVAVQGQRRERCDGGLVAASWSRCGSRSAPSRPPGREEDQADRPRRARRRRRRWRGAPTSPSRGGACGRRGAAVGGGVAAVAVVIGCLLSNRLDTVRRAKVAMMIGADHDDHALRRRPGRSRGPGRRSGRSVYGRFAVPRPPEVMVKTSRSAGRCRWSRAAPPSSRYCRMCGMRHVAEDLPACWRRRRGRPRSRRAAATAGRPAGSAS